MSEAGRKRGREEGAANAEDSAARERTNNAEHQQKNETAKASSAKGENEGHQLGSYMQILGTDTGDSCPCVQIFTGSSRLLFNAGDGLQRFFTQHQIRMTKLEHLFLTRVDADTVGGLLGMYLTLSDVGVRQLTVHGPPGTARFIQGGSAFCENRAESRLEPDEMQPDSDNMIVQPSFTIKPLVAFAPPSMPAAGDDEGADAGAVQSKAKRPVAGRGAGVSYFVRFADEPGKLDAKKAVQLGVPQGPLLGKLKNGQPVTLPNGTVIEPALCVDPPHKGPVIAILDCPSTAHLPSFLASTAWEGPPPKPGGGKGKGNAKKEAAKSAKKQKTEQADASTEGEQGGGGSRGWNATAWEGVPVACVVHLSPAAVLSDRRYMERSSELAGGTATHVILNTAACPDQNPFPSHFKVFNKLNGLDSVFFPLSPSTTNPSSSATGADQRPGLKEALSAGGWRAADVSAEAHQGSSRGVTEQRLWQEGWGRPGAVVAGRVLLRLGVSPARYAGWDESRWWEGYADESTASDTTAQQDIAMPAIDDTSQDAPAWLLEVDRNQMEVVTLGTAASVPGKYRNVSGIFVDLFDRGGVLLDCGEGTLGQLMRKYGREGGKAKLEALKCVWVSHMHADHHLGLLRVLSHRSACSRQRCANGETSLPTLTVIGPPPLRRWLTTYQTIEEGVEFDFVDNARLVPGKEYVGADCASVLEGLLVQSLKIQITTVHVRHSCRDACGVALSNQDGAPWKLVYSGDTRPCKELVSLGQGATLLIHEATFENSMQDHAKFKQHSTTEEALRIGQQMGAYRTVLSHFSQRYAKAPLVSEVEGSKAAVAFDLMTFNLKDLPRLPSILAPLSKLCNAQGWQPEGEA